MPPMFLLDNYEECLRDPEGLYCSAEFAVVSDEPSALLTMMQVRFQHILGSVGRLYSCLMLCSTNDFIALPLMKESNHES